jgi:hypothetical protein
VPEHIDRAHDEEMTFGRILRGSPTFLSLVAIGLVIAGIVGGVVVVAVSAVLWVLPLPFDP